MIFYSVITLTALVLAYAVRRFCAYTDTPQPCNMHAAATNSVQPCDMHAVAADPGQVGGMYAAASDSAQRCRMYAATGCAAKRAAGGIRTRRGTAAAKLCMVLLFTVLALPAVLRQAVGNDYMRYVEIFHLANDYQIVPTEPGFNTLVRILYGLCGYENYLLVFAVYAITTIVFFLIAIWQQAEDFFASFALFMLFGYYFQSYNTMRYYFALSIVIFSIRYFLERNYPAFVTLVVFASLFHKSMLAVLILYPMAVHVWKIWQMIPFAAVLVSMPLCQNFWNKVMLKLYPSYNNTMGFIGAARVSWGNIVRCAAVMVLGICIMHGRVNLCGISQRERRLRFYMQANAMGLLVYVFGSFIPEVSRICYMLTLTQIFFIPSLIRMVPDEQVRLRRSLVIVTAICAAVIFCAFLHSAWAQDVRILPYRTFLFNELPGTPSESIR